MTEPAGNAHLQRRVLLTGVATLALFLVVAVTITSSGLPDWVIVPAVVLLYVLVTRPLMQPVRDAVRLRRELAFHAFQEHRREERG